MKRIALFAACLLSTRFVALAADRPQVKPWGVDLNYIDKNVKPSDGYIAGSTHASLGVANRVDERPARPHQQE